MPVEIVVTRLLVEPQTRDQSTGNALTSGQDMVAESSVEPAIQEVCLHWCSQMSGADDRRDTTHLPARQPTQVSTLLWVFNTSGVRLA